MDANLEFDFGGLDGLWLIFGLPLVAILVFALLSPFSFFIHKQLSKRNAGNVAADD